MSTQLNDSAETTSSNNLNHRAAMYSLAAAVAGVGMLALVQPAVGEVVITKKTIPIPLSPHSMQEPVAISMANNGIENFSFILSSSQSGRGLRELVAGGVDAGSGGAQNQILIGGAFYGKVLALPRGAKIGPSPEFSSYFPLVEATSSNGGTFYGRGYWSGNPQNRYVGVRFQINGQTHYGWIRLSVTMDVKLDKPTMAAKITAYAYETVANKPILAGTAGVTAPATTADVQTPGRGQSGPSLGMLARGADAVPMWRSEDTLTTK